MHITTPDPWVRDGEFSVRANPGGNSGHFAIVEMGDDPHPWKVGLTLHDVGDCDRIMRAVSTAKRMLETISAGTLHVFAPGAAEYRGHCATCGLLRDAQAHITPEQLGADGQGEPCDGRAVSPSPAIPAITAA